MKKYLLGIDNGGTVCKAAAFDLNGRLALKKSIMIPLTVNRGGMTERSIESIIEGNFSIIREITSELDGEIIGVGFSGHGKGLYMLDKEGKPLGNGIGSTDTRAYEYEKYYNESGIAEKAYEKIYQRVLACQPVCLLKWIKDNDRSTYDKIGAVLSVNDLIGYYLTGEIRAELTSASGSSLMNLNTREFDKELTELYGIEEIYPALPRPVGSCELRGNVSAEAARATGLKAGTPVSGGMFDIDACALAAGCTSEGDTCMIAGTWSINEFITSSPMGSGASMNSIYCCEGLYLAEESSPASAGNLEWVRGIMKERSYRELDNMVSDIPTESSKVYFFPFLFASNLTPNAKASFIGLESGTCEGEIIRAVYEGVVYSSYTHLEKLLGGVTEKPKFIKLAGGVLKSEPWRQMFADTVGITIETADSDEPGCLGAAMSAGVAGGIYESPTAAAAACVAAGRILTPDPEKTKLYRRKYETYRRIESAMSGIWKEINNA